MFLRVIPLDIYLYLYTYLYIYGCIGKLRNSHMYCGLLCRRGNPANVPVLPFCSVGVVLRAFDGEADSRRHCAALSGAARASRASN